jgi:hypothetical protein
MGDNASVLTESLCVRCALALVYYTNGQNEWVIKCAFKGDNVRPATKCMHFSGGC